MQAGHFDDVIIYRSGHQRVESADIVVCGRTHIFIMVLVNVAEAGCKIIGVCCGVPRQKRASTLESIGLSDTLTIVRVGNLVGGSILMVALVIIKEIDMEHKTVSEVIIGEDRIAVEKANRKIKRQRLAACSITLEEDEKKDYIIRLEG